MAPFWNFSSKAFYFLSKFFKCLSLIYLFNFAYQRFVCLLRLSCMSNKILYTNYYSSMLFKNIASFSFVFPFTPARYTSLLNFSPFRYKSIVLWMSRLFLLINTVLMVHNPQNSKRQASYVRQSFFSENSFLSHLLTEAATRRVTLLFNRRLCFAQIVSSY